MENLENRNISYDKLLQTILDIGEEMVVAGAEVSRVEESIQRMCRATAATASTCSSSFPICR